MVHPSAAALQAAIDNATRGHRSFEWENVAARLVKAAESYREHIAAERRDAPKGLQQMQDEVTAWCERKGWKGEGSAPVTFGDTMALLHSEVSEALEAFRDWGLADATASEGRHTPGCAASDHTVFGGSLSDRPDCTCGAVAKPEGVGSEFADILIRLLDDCDRWGVDLAAEYERKMAYNETRAFQHGGRAL